MIRMLDKRAQVLLKTLIERYIAEGQPVDLMIPRDDRLDRIGGQRLPRE